MDFQKKPLLRYGFVGMIVFLLLAAGLPVSQVSAAATSSNIAAGRGPHAVAVNPVTSRIYVANADSDSVTVLEDTYSGGVVTVANVEVGTTPYAVAVNPVTNKIYVANVDSDTVTVIDGLTNNTIEVDVGILPFAVAVNTLTNKIYVANLGSDTVTVIDGATTDTDTETATVQVGESPFAIAVNEAANKMYVANVDGDMVTVIDGVSNSPSSVSTGAGPNALAVNPLTGSVYVANFYSNTVTVIDGATGDVSTLNVGITPTAVEVNPVTGMIYVTNTSSNNMTVIDGANHNLSTVSVGSGPSALAINAVTNKIYVANYDSNNVTVIDGMSLMTSTIAAGTNPIAAAVNTGLNKVYVANFNSDEITVIADERVTDADLSTLSVSRGSLSPAFDPSINSYSVHVGNEVENVTVTAAAYDSAASISVTDQVYGNNAEIPVSLHIGANVLPIVVHAADELTSRTYTVTIYRAGDTEPNADLSEISVSAGALQPLFAPEVLSYSVEVGYTVSSISVTAVTYDPATTIRINGQSYNGGVSNPVSLQVGSNQVMLVTTAADGLTSKTYTLTVNRAEAPIEYRPPTPSDTSTLDKTDTLKPESEDVKETTSGATLTSRAAAFTVKAAAETNGKAEATAMLHADSLTKAFSILKGKTKGSQTILFEIPGTEAIRNVGIPARLLTAAANENPNALIKIKTENASYTLPINFPTLTAQLKQLGGKLEQATVFITMETITGAAKEQMAQQAKAAGMTLVGDIIDFTLSIEVDGNKQVFTDFGRTYVSRSIVAAGTESDRGSDMDMATAVRINPQTGEFSFVPSTFTTTNGLTEVHIFRTGNSLYTIAQSKKSFADLQGHWSQTDVELLASKLIVNGQTEADFVPEGNVTRAEFVSLIIRALGLEEDSMPAQINVPTNTQTNPPAFTDIAETDWFAGAIGAAVKAQIVSGFEDGTFRPNDTITREQMAVMLSNALLFANKPIAVAGKLLPLLAVFEDKSAISPWAQVAAAQMLESGMMTGITEHQFAPQDKATRAQAAVVIKRMLQTAGFMN
ncbi:cadherin-like beta sandwich domain-containing protein [Paenibacillus eucommiae]|uniref:YVTN family beta-propeller protein n=1 Tax=Paenibacillus eucommiae TaxID=1355755 RepID=A0ABS4IZG0_9BACL|nr:cadherin-like beta sandwich domain-containing protein [Paenibacillus eucommiae]MBP1992978.1 YVTN family beta-propeller protein [Paenibacillus eucommiae]